MSLESEGKKTPESCVPGHRVSGSPPVDRRRRPVIQALVQALVVVELEVALD
jgi:hypothetical protein